LKRYLGLRKPALVAASTAAAAETGFERIMHGEKTGGAQFGSDDPGLQLPIYREMRRKVIFPHGFDSEHS
jgi:hypothetical protein